MSLRVVSPKEPCRNDTAEQTADERRGRKQVGEKEAGERGEREGKKNINY